MNKLLNFFMLLMLVATPLTFCSCGGDDDKEDDEPEIVTPIVGTWSGSVKDDDIELAISYTFRSNGQFMAVFNRIDHFDEENFRTINGSYTYNMGRKELSMKGYDSQNKPYSLTAECEIQGNTMIWRTSDGEVIKLTK